MDHPPRIHLTPEQQLQLPLWRDRWRRHLLKTGAADRAKVEALVPSLYRVLGAAPPEKVVWRPWRALPSDLPPHNASLVFSEWHLYEEMRERVYNFVQRVVHLLRPPPNLPLPALPFGQFNLANSGMVPALDFCIQVLKLDAVPRKYQLMIKLAKSVGGVAPAFDTCYLFDHPVRFSLNNQNELHSVTGPALAFENGLRVYAHHGRVHPALAEIMKKVEARDGIVRMADIRRAQDRTVRAALIDMYMGGAENGGGLGAYLMDEGAKLIDDDPHYGALYVLWHDRADEIRAVRVLNSSPEPDGTYKHYWLRVPPRFIKARAAVAWTFRLRGAEYEPVKET